MAQYWEDWSGAEIGSASLPTGWTSRWDSGFSVEVVSDASAPSGKSLRITNTVSSRKLITFDAVNSDPSRDNCEVRILVRCPSSIANGDNYVGCAGRASGDGSAETGYSANLYAGPTYAAKRLFEYNAGTTVSTISEDLAARATYQSKVVWLKLRCNGSTIGVGVADIGTPETENYDTTTDTSITAAGWCGVTTFTTGKVIEILAVGVGTNGDSAPTSAPSDTTAPTLSSASGTATGSTTASGSVTTDEGNGTLYAVATTSATAPTKAQVKAGQDHTGASATWSGSQAVSSTGSKSVSVTGLSASTTYYLHFMHEDAATNQSDVASSSSFMTAAGIVIRADYERSSVNMSGSSVSGTGDDAVITIKPRLQETEAVSGTTRMRWLEPSARIDGVSGVRPTFRFIDYAATAADGTYHGAPWASTRKPMFSYDRETWQYFDTCTVNTSDVTFRHNSVFSSSPVYISRERQMSVSQIGAWLEDMAETYPTIFAPTATAAAFTPTLTSWPGQAFIADEFLAQTNELNAAIPATPFYSAMIGSGPTLAVMSCGVHAGEDHANYLFRAMVEALCGDSADAVTLRSCYTILLYPMINAPGRAGGGWRGSFTQGASGADDANRHWSETGSGLEIVNKPKAVMLADLNGATPSWCFDFHGTTSTTWGMYQGDTVAESFRALIASVTGYTITNMGSFTHDALGNWYDTGLGATLSATLEFGCVTPITDEQITDYAVGALTALVAMSHPVVTATAQAEGTDEVSASVTTTKSGGTIYAVVTTSATPPSSASIVADPDDTASATTAGAYALSVTGLTHDTLYYWHIVHVDGESLTSNVLTVSVTTDDYVYPVVTATASAVSASEVSATATTTKAGGTISAQITTSATAPDAADIISDPDDTATVTDAGEYSLSVTGLTFNTAYWWHIVHVDGESLESSVVTVPVRTLDLSITLDFPDTAPCSLLGYQVWSKLGVTDEEIIALWEE